MSSESDVRIADYFVVCGLSETSQPLKDEGTQTPSSPSSGTNTWMNADKKDPITDICIIDKTMEEQCPIGFTCVEWTPTGFESNLNHGSISSHNLAVCYKRGRNEPPIIDIGVYDEGLDVIKTDVTTIQTTPAGRSANVNNASGMGSHPIYLTYRRAKESAPQNSLVVTDICIILPNKGEKAPYAYLEINKNLNKGLLGSNVHLCYKKSVRQVDSIAFRADLLARYPQEDTGSFALPDSQVALFCLPMGATIECWGDKTNHPLPCFSSFVLTTETSDKIYGTTVTFYESYPEARLTERERHQLRLLRGDGRKSSVTRTVHTNKAICLLSRWPMFTVFKDFLMYLYRMTVSPHPHRIPVERYIAHFMHKLPFPTPQRPIVEYQISPMINITITRPQMTPIPLSGASFVTLLENLGADNTLNLLALALTEHKIVIHSLRVSEITCVAEALVSLLFPFKWTCIYIPLCPLEMCHVLEAPCPFVAGVDSRYFDLFVPPPDIVCVNLDTNSVTLMEEKKSVGWRMLPRKATKYARTKLHQLYKELKEHSSRDQADHVIVGLNSSFRDPDLVRVERHRRIDREIQECFLKLMVCMMRGYRRYLLPITQRPTAATTDPGSLFNIQEFVRSRERGSQPLFKLLVSCQLFTSFVEQRSLASLQQEDSTSSASRTSGLVFFDQCIDRFTSDHQLDTIRLIEADSIKSDHTVIIIPPEELSRDDKGGYLYQLFPQLRPDLFLLDDDDDDEGDDVIDRDDATSRCDATTDGGDDGGAGDVGATSSSSSGAKTKRNRSDASTYARRTMQELRAQQKISRLQSKNAVAWAKLLLGHAYGCWFACLPALVQASRHHDAALRIAHEQLHKMKERQCLLHRNDESFYRILLHLCSVYDKPQLAKRVFRFTQTVANQQNHNKSDEGGGQISAITYGLYNKAVLEGTWLQSTHRSGYSLWERLRVVWCATVRLRILWGMAQRGNETSSDLDSASSHSSAESGETSTPAATATSGGQDPPRESDAKKRDDDDDAVDDVTEEARHSDHGYNSMPKTLVRRSLEGDDEKDENENENGARTEAAAADDVTCSDVTITRKFDEITLGQKSDLSAEMTSDHPTIVSSNKSEVATSPPATSSTSTERDDDVTPTADDVTTEKASSHVTGKEAEEKSRNDIFAHPVTSSSTKPDDDDDVTTTDRHVVHSTPMRGAGVTSSSSSSKRVTCDPLTSPLSLSRHNQHDDVSDDDSKASKQQRHLVEEIDNFMNRSALLVRCSSDATISSSSNNARRRLANSNNATATSAAADASSAGNPPKQKSQTMERNMTSSSASFRHKQDDDKHNHFLSRSMTFGGGGDSSWLSSPKFINGFIKSKTMSLASKAKQAATSMARDFNDTMAYYTNEVKGSLNDVSSSRTSLRSVESTASDNKHQQREAKKRAQVGNHGNSNNQQQQSGGNHGNQQQQQASRNRRPCSMPPVPNSNDDYSLPPTNTTTTTTSSKEDQCKDDKQEIVVVRMSSCSKCSRCKALVYDEEIMAGWTDDHSNLNTHCSACNFLFVPFLNIEITDRRKSIAAAAAVGKNGENPLSPVDDDDVSSSKDKNVKVVELAFPYLSPLVLRKEVESLLENETSSVLSSSNFVDHHPIIYWNLVWYFRRLNLYSNLYDLVLKSAQLTDDDDVIRVGVTSQYQQVSLGSKSSSGCVRVKLMWDNINLHLDRDRQPIYCVWNQIMESKNSGRSSQKTHQYPISLITSIRDSITNDDDVRSPLVALLSEFHVHRSKLRRSAYREILFFIIVALGKDWIDVDAFDREYKRAYDALTLSELDLFDNQIDSLPTPHATACRRTFGTLDLY